MVIGVGVDIIEVQRVSEIIERYGERFYNKVFTDEEVKYCNSKAKPSQHFAARFAAKEAFSKAIGTGLGKEFILREIEIVRDAKGKPSIRTKRKIKEKIMLSISHSDNYVVAVCVIES
ncbi:MAG: holo-[acyl-carrier-protein] synthase [Ignavibacteria bacterium]|nr:holo-[acyl-carrier-protein] synthase [Ignavibacteria bacterium]